MSFALNGVDIEDTFAEGFRMWGARIIITAKNLKWANIAAREMTGFATSVIACDCEAGIEREIPSDETPDGRPGASVLLFAFDPDGVANRLVERIGQCVMTCPTTACFNGLEA
ncbi:MAG: formylmethanofuran--tetrahydromethanopterin N-formyltransferase, partial [Candidatus Bathyarchaeota archaeon]|nr:formylmethanofuran--tetrahydromethanopterin N-formyltransferase [Candidatus Bathyarchaeota archaeon]